MAVKCWHRQTYKKSLSLLWSYLLFSFKYYYLSFLFSYRHHQRYVQWCLFWLTYSVLDTNYFQVLRWITIINMHRLLIWRWQTCCWHNERQNHCYTARQTCCWHTERQNHCSKTNILLTHITDILQERLPTYW